MRKFGTILTLLALVILCAVLLPTEAHAETEGYYTYTVSNGEAYIESVDTALSGDISIPSTLGGYPVVAIESNAIIDGRNITNITIPASVENIAADVFGSCSSLIGIWVDDGNLSLSSDASGVLYNKDKTELIRCPRARSGEYSIPVGVTCIGNQAFQGCIGLTGITISNSVTTISYAAFRSCIELSNITIPAGVTDIGDSAFAHCKKLMSVVIPESVTDIAQTAFSRCDSLAEIWVDTNNPSYLSDSYGILYNKAKTKLIYCPCAFSGSYTIPTGVTIIGENAFSNCSSLISVTIPDSVTYIDWYAFDSDHLWHILYTGSEDKWDDIVNRAGLAETTIHYNCTGNEITDPVNKVCTLCTPACAHTYDNACDTACNLCGDTRTITHTPGAAATATTDQTCTVCGKVLAKATGETPSGGQTGGNATQSTTAPTQEETHPAQTTPPATTPPVQESTQPATQPTDGATAPVTQPATQPSQGDSSPTTQATAPSATTGAEAESSGVTTLPATSGAPADSGKDGGGAVWIVVVLVILGGGGVAAGIILWKKKHG